MKRIVLQAKKARTATWLPAAKAAYRGYANPGASRACLKNRNSRLFLQRAASAALKMLGIRQDSCAFCLASAHPLRKIRQFLYSQTRPNNHAERYIQHLMVTFPVPGSKPVRSRHGRLACTLAAFEKRGQQPYYIDLCKTPRFGKKRRQPQNLKGRTGMTPFR